LDTTVCRISIASPASRAMTGSPSSITKLDRHRRADPLEREALALGGHRKAT
jgi:hypothetical protein